MSAFKKTEKDAFSSFDLRIGKTKQEEPVCALGPSRFRLSAKH